MTRYTFLTAICALLFALSGSALAQCEDAKVTASDPAPNDRFANSVSLFGDTALVGMALDDNAAGMNAGSAFVYERSGTDWLEVAQLIGSDTSGRDQFGVSVSLHGDTALVGAWLHDDLGTESGSAYMFERTESGWTETQKLTSSDGAPGDAFGVSVAIDGDRAIVGAIGDDDHGSRSGAGYIFERNGSMWVETAKLTANDGEMDDLLGSSVAISGDIVVLGAPGDDDLANFSGAGYIFEKTPSGWVETAKLTHSSLGVADQFGGAVSAWGNRVLIGPEGGLEAAIVYERTDSGWVEDAILRPGDGVDLDCFGVAVSLVEDAALVSSREDDVVGFNSGSTYLFQRTAMGWVETMKFHGCDGSSFDHFGFAVSLSGTHALVGARDHDGDAGAAYFFDLSLGSTYCTPSVNSLGVPGQIYSLGASPVSLAANEFVLRAASIPDQTTLFFYGVNQVELPFGDGLRCVGNPMFRLLPVGVASGNVFTYAVDLTNPPEPAGMITSGSTWNFQAWYRDPDAGGTGFNASGGLEVIFAP